MQTSGLPPFQKFLDAHRECVWRLLVAAVGREDADDCFQETFMAALVAYPRLRKTSNLRAWVLAIAHNKAMDHHRARVRRPAPVADVPEVTVTLEGGRGFDGMWDAVRELPPKQRAAVTLRFAGDLTHRELGVALDCTEETARRAVYDGLTTLRKAWTP